MPCIEKVGWGLNCFCCLKKKFFFFPGTAAIAVKNDEGVSLICFVERCILFMWAFIISPFSLDLLGLCYQPLLYYQRKVQRERLLGEVERIAPSQGKHEPVTVAYGQRAHTHPWPSGSLNAPCLLSYQSVDSTFRWTWKIRGISLFSRGKFASPGSLFISLFIFRYLRVKLKEKTG